MIITTQKHIENKLNTHFSTALKFKWQLISGGSINNTYKISANKQVFFVKTNKKTIFKNGFKEEVLGLTFLENKKVIVPKISVEGTFKETVFLVLQWIDSGKQNQKFWENLANQLATLHQQTNTNFGLDYNNYMGQLLQKNTKATNFSNFFIENRLVPQVKLAFNSKLLTSTDISKFENLYTQLPTIFPKEKPSAVHGDLWSGNFMCTTNSQAVFIDPAVYFGHREVDIAMSLLFGGFSNKFYTVYQEIYPLKKEFNTRKDIYNLYPLLVHLNLFGSSYLGSIKAIIAKF